MGRSSGMLFYSKTLFSLSGIADPVTITEGTDIIMMEIPNVQ